MKENEVVDPNISLQCIKDVKKIELFSFPSTNLIEVKVKLIMKSLIEILGDFRK